MANPYKIEYGRDYVRIVRKYATRELEVLYWDVQEWTEDPETAFAIFRAIEMAVGDPKAMDKKVREIAPDPKGWSPRE